MKVTAINGSPKGESSNSREVIAIVRGMLDPAIELDVVSQIKQARHPDDSVFQAMAESDVLFIASSLFVDALPASLMAFLERYARFRASLPPEARAKRQRVFAVMNCGFYEGKQNACALKILSHYCAYAGLAWSGGVGLGTGEMIAALKDVPPQASIRKPVIRAIRDLADAIARGPDGKLDRDEFAQHGFPWFLYKFMGEMGWRSQAKKNGLRGKDLFRRPLERMAR
jgi:multimeric flavodoxin WrbA